MSNAATATPLKTSLSWYRLGLGLVLGIRIIYILSLPNTIDHDFRDGLSYDNIARNLLSGVGYWDKTGEWPSEPPYADPASPTLRWMPGYPFFIAGVYLLFGKTYWAVYFCQVVLGVGIASFVYLLAKYTLGERVAILAVFLYATEVFSIWLCGRFQTEQLFTFLLVAALYCFVRMIQEQRAQIRFAVLFGLLAGAGTLTRPVAGLTFVGLCAVALATRQEPLNRTRPGTRGCAVITACVVFVGSLGPWLVRNYKLTGAFVLSTEAWQTLTMANNDDGRLYFTPQGLSGMPRTSIEQSEIERERLYRAFVINWVAKHPGQFMQSYIKRAIAFWSPLIPDVETRFVRALIAVTFNTVLVLFATMCIFTHRRLWRKFLPIYVTLISFTLGYSLAFVSTRFRFPIYPLLEILAAGGMLFVFDKYSLSVVRRQADLPSR
jgi:4-amino-4-deoxy-L-arabinose transferase-like glycosyltransferase